MDDNNNVQMKPLMDKLIRFARTYDMAILFLDHSRKRKVKDYGTALKMDDVIGATVKTRYSSVIIGIEKRQADDGSFIHSVRCLGSWHKEFHPLNFN